jgi:hypothetical protein
MGGGVLGMEVRMESVEGVATVGRDDGKKTKGRHSPFAVSFKSYALSSR